MTVGWMSPSLPPERYKELEVPPLKVMLNSILCSYLYMEVCKKVSCCWQWGVYWGNFHLAEVFSVPCNQSTWTKHLHHTQVLKMDSLKWQINGADGFKRRNVSLEILSTILEDSCSFYPLVMLYLYLPTPAEAFVSGGSRGGFTSTFKSLRERKCNLKAKTQP